MRIIRHRVNAVSTLRAIDPEHGAEFDVRSRGSKLILNHEPFQDGESLETFLSCYAEARRTGTLIFNPKEDGLEKEMLALAERFQLPDFFLLDLAAPTLVRLALQKGIVDVAVRVSEHEPLEAALRFKSKAKWAWVDCFTGKPPAREVVSELKKHFKVCLVSPELQGYPKEAIRDFAGLVPLVDAVCTKNPELWKAI
jgi:hypothetical protein